MRERIYSRQEDNKNTLTETKEIKTKGTECRKEVINMSKVMINMEELEQVNGGKDFTDVVVDKVVDGLVAAKDGVVDGAKWVGKTIFSWFH